MEQSRPAPAPKGSSCLTCRHRRKKCDRARPTCQRCTTSGFKCFGYDNDENEVDISSNSQRGAELLLERQESSLSKHKLILPRIAIKSVSYTRQKPQPRDRARNEAPSHYSLDETNSEYPLNPIPPCTQTPVIIEHSAHLFRHTKNPSGVSETDPALNHNNAVFTDSLDNFDDLWPQNQSQSLIRLTSVLQPIPVMENAINPEANAIKELGSVRDILCRTIPLSIDADGFMRKGYCTFVLSQYLSQRVRKWFLPPLKSTRDTLLVPVARNGALVWFFYLGAKMFEQLSDNPLHAVVRPYVHWMNKCDESLTNSLNANCSVEELQNRLMVLLELVFLKFVAIGTQAGYSLLRRTVPVFIGLVSSDPSLWVERQGLLVISLTRALDFYRYDVRRFVFRESMVAFALGTLSFVEYDTSDCSTVTIPPEWTHGIPTEFIMSVVQVNAWRASSPGVSNTDDWLELELQTLGWIPKTMQLTGEDSREDSYEVVARLAVQETWRHAVLIYIYMGMCLVDSHDPRVQRSVHQILHLMHILSKSPLEIQLLLPYLTAGIAARHEHQRATVRKKLASFFGDRVWLLPGEEFTWVLDHLWQGVAAGGAPVTWKDYVHSRRTMLPVA